LKPVGASYDASAGGWISAFALVGGIAIAYLLTARLGLALLSARSDVAVFWPASGVAAGILITFGPRVRPALVIGVVVGTVAAGLLGHRELVTSIFNGTWNAGEAALAAWLLERWFGQPFTFANLRHVAGFLVAACLATAASGVGGAFTLTLLHPETTAPLWDVWREWFLSSWVGLVVVAPLVIGTAQTWRRPPTREEWIEAIGVLSLTLAACAYTMVQETSSWLTFSPGAFVLPLLLWLTARCQSTFAIAGAFLASAAIICAITFGIGRFGDAAVPVMQRVTGAQLAIMTVTISTLVLAVLFAQRKKAEESLEKERAMLARLHEVGSRLWLKRDLGQALDEILEGAIELLGADMGAIRIWNSARGTLRIEAHRGFTCEYLDLFRHLPVESTPPCQNVLRSGERMVIEDVEEDTRFAPFRPLARAAGYRALQSTRILSRKGAPLGVLGTHFRSVHKPSDQDLRLLDLYVRQAADIIEHHRAEDSVRASEERLRLAQLKTGVGVWDWDLHTDEVTWTPELAAIYGVEPAYMKCYADFRDRIHPDDVGLMRANQEAAVQRGDTFRNEFRIIRPDGQVRWLLSMGGAVYDAVTGKPTRILGNNVDITERKVAEIALAERNQQLALAAKAGLVATFAYDVKTERVQISEGYAAIYGFPEGTTEIARSQWRALVLPDDLERLEGLRSQAFADRQREYALEYRILLPDRGVRWIETRSFISYDGEGRPERVVGVNIDVTERRRMEQALIDRNRQLELAGKAALVGSFVIDIDTAREDFSSQRIQFSPGFAAIYGLPEETTEISVGDWRRLVHPDDLPQFVEHRQQLFAERRGEHHAEHRIVDPSGTIRWIETRSFIEYDQAGHAKRLVGVNIDITERKRAERALAERNTQLELASKIARVGTFVVEFHTGLVKLSPGCASIFGLPESTAEITREYGLNLVLPEDLPQLKLRRDQAFLKQQREFVAQYRIRRVNDSEVRWMELRGLNFYGRDGQPSRAIAIIIDFTERKLAEEMLAERNLQLALAGKVGRVGTYTLDIDAKKLQVSEGYAALHGLPEGSTEMTLSEWRARVHPEDLGRVENVHIQAAAAKRREYTVEYRIVRRDGEVRWTERRCLILYDSDARPQRVVGVSIDITERKRAELALAERDAQLTLAANAARVGCYANNLKTGLITVSEGYTAIHGLPEGTVQTTLDQWRTKVHPDDLATFDEVRERFFGNRDHDYRFDYRIIHDNGEVRWIESRGCISYDEDGRPERVIGINIDVTERKQTEARLSDALAAGQVVAFEWDAVTDQSQRSGNAERILGILQGGGFLRQVHPADRRNFNALIRKLTPGNPSYTLTFRFSRADGRDVWLEEEAKGEFDATGKLLRIKGLTRDITERKELEDHKNSLISELDHRVKNVLATVSAVASRTRETSRSMAEFVAALDGRIKSMAITHELLSSRHWQGVPLAELVRRELAPYATASNTHIDGPDVVLSAEAGPILAMVFHELATNAAKFGGMSVKSGRASVRWELRCDEHEESWLNIRWEESGGPPVAQPTRSGFGTTAVRELVPYELSGTVELAHLPEGVCCNLHIPAQWLTASAR